MGADLEAQQESGVRDGLSYVHYDGVSHHLVTREDKMRFESIISLALALIVITFLMYGCSLLLAGGFSAEMIRAALPYL